MRANYTFLRQTGSVYNTDVYGYAFLAAVPGFAHAYPNFVAGPATVDQLRKYDIANRTENKLDLMSTIAPRDDLTITASFRGDWNSYPAQIGRQGYNTYAAQISTEWTPTPTDSASAYIGYDHSTLRIGECRPATRATPRHAASSVARFIRLPVAGGNPIMSATIRPVRHCVIASTAPLSILNWSYIYVTGHLGLHRRLAERARLSERVRHDGERFPRE